MILPENRFPLFGIMRSCGSAAAPADFFRFYLYRILG